MKTLIILFVLFCNTMWAQLNIYSLINSDSLFVIPGQCFDNSYYAESEDSLLALRTRLSSEIKETFVLRDMRIFYSGYNYTFFFEDDSYSHTCNLYANSRQAARKSFFIFSIYNLSLIPIGREYELYINISGATTNLQYLSKTKKQTLCGRDGIKGDLDGNGIININDVNIYNSYFTGYEYYQRIYANSDQINYGNACILFPWPDLVSCELLNLFNNDSSEPLVQGYGIGQKFSDFPIPAPQYKNYVIDNNVIIVEAGPSDAISIVGRKPDGSRWQSDLLGGNITEIPEGLSDIIVLGNNVSSLTDLKENISTLPNLFTLSQNYPNPFNPSTTIKFNIPKSEYVTLKVYDVLGKEVATLVNEELNSGTYQKQWDASELSSGMYVYTIHTGSFTASKKMLLLK